VSSELYDTNQLINRFAPSLDPAELRIVEDVRAYVEWQSDRLGDEFLPRDSDDVHLRAYGVHLRSAGVGRASLRERLASLKRFYAWALADGLISESPFAEYKLDQPVLRRDQIRRRKETQGADPQTREITRLRALNKLADHLNRSADLQSALNGALEILVELMGLRTAWGFLWTEAGTLAQGIAGAPHDFALAACCGLPPGLESENRRHLREPPDCYCQHLMRESRLVRAANVVECSRLPRASGDTQGLQFHATVPLISQGRPLGIINVATENWEFLTATDLQLLSAVGAQVATAVERARLYDLAEDQRARLERELEMAREMQASLLPAELPEIAGFSLAAAWRSAREVAGDFYDIFLLPDERWGIVVADVSDKGAAAALYMAMVRSLIRTQAERTPSPAAALALVNRALLAQSSSGMFVTAFSAILDPTDGTFSFTVAGHDPPLVRRASGMVERLPTGGLLLGLFDNVRLTDEMLRLEPGDALVIYTDGLTEATNLRGDEYGRARLGDAISTAPAPAPALVHHLLADHAAHTRNTDQGDDITLFIVARE